MIMGISSKHANEALAETSRHNSWATKHLIGTCRGLSEEQLTSTPPGTYGTIRATFNHIILSDIRYLRSLGGTVPDWAGRDGSPDLDELEAWVDEAGVLWERFLSEPVDPERVIVVDKGANEGRAGI